MRFSQYQGSAVGSTDHVQEVEWKVMHCSNEWQKDNYGALGRVRPGERLKWLVAKGNLANAIINPQDQ